MVYYSSVWLIWCFFFNSVVENNGIGMSKTPHILIFVDEDCFNLASGWRRAMVDVHGGCPGLVRRQYSSTHIPILGPYNTQKLLIFLDCHFFELIPENERGLIGPHLPNYVNCEYNVNFPRVPLIMVHCSSKGNHGVSTTLPSFAQSYWGVFLCLEVESVWSGTRSEVPAPCKRCCVWQYYRKSVLG